MGSAKRKSVEVSVERYLEVMGKTVDREYTLTLTGLQVGTLHGAVKLAAIHPEVKKMSPEFHAVLNYLRDWASMCLKEMGFLEEEVAYLDSELT